MIRNGSNTIQAAASTSAAGASGPAITSYPADPRVGARGTRASERRDYGCACEVGVAVAFKRELLERGVTSGFPGETMVAYTISNFVGGAGPTPGSHSSTGVDGDEERRQLRHDLGLTDDGWVDQWEMSTFIALTQQRLVIGSRSSVRNRPKDLIVEAPRSEVTAHWFDSTVGPSWFRHWVIEFGGGRWRQERTGLKVLGKTTKIAAATDELVAALGDRAVQH